MGDRRVTLIAFLVLCSLLVSVLNIPAVRASSDLWSRTYGGTSIDCAEALVHTSDGGYALAGDSWSIDNGDTDFWLVKTDENGNMEWNQMYGGEGLEDAYALVETSDGGYAIAGTTNRDSWLAKTDAYGNMEWNRTYGGSETETAHSLIETSDGGYALAGHTEFSPGFRHDFWLVKTDAYGDMEWNQTYRESGMNEAYELVETSDGGFALAGGSLLVKTDAYGNMEWNKTYDEGRINSLVKSSGGGYALAGNKNDDFWLAKTDEHGYIPEFPSWIILPLFLTATFSAIVLKRRLFHQRS